MSQTKLTDSCDHCVYSELSPNVYPRSKCSSQQEHFTPDPICQKCEHADTPVAEYPCQTCRDESGRRHYMESTESTESTEPVSPCQSCPHAGTPPLQQPCADCGHNGLSAGIQRNREAEYQRFVEEMNARPAACICGENPEYVEDNIYPGEVHRYVVCNGSHPVPHSLSVHGGNSREETIGRWNAFIFNLKNNK